MAATRRSPDSAAASPTPAGASTNNVTSALATSGGPSGADVATMAVTAIGAATPANDNPSTAPSPRQPTVPGAPASAAPETFIAGGAVSGAGDSPAARHAIQSKRLFGEPGNADL